LVAPQRLDGDGVAFNMFRIALERGFHDKAKKSEQLRRTGEGRAGENAIQGRADFPAAGLLVRLFAIHRRTATPPAIPGMLNNRHPISKKYSRKRICSILLTF
jgi:hypothetical protein